jgi:hypothetical protein
MRGAELGDIGKTATEQMEEARKQQPLDIETVPSISTTATTLKSISASVLEKVRDERRQSISSTTSSTG